MRLRNTSLRVPSSCLGSRSRHRPCCYGQEDVGVSSCGFYAARDNQAITYVTVLSRRHRLAGYGLGVRREEYGFKEVALTTNVGMDVALIWQSNFRY